MNECSNPRCKSNRTMLFVTAVTLIVVSSYLLVFSLVSLLS